MAANRAEALALIKRNIEKSGFHIYSVGGSGPTPRFVYTIGLRESLGAELVLAGALFYEKLDDVLAIVHSLREQLAKETPKKLGSRWHGRLIVRDRGAFTFRRADSSWVKSLLLGALDYYQIEDVDAYQIVPEEKHHTIDVPNMANAWSAASEPIWQWLHEAWRYPIPESSQAMTDLSALRGGSVTEACRWEDDYWEMTAAPTPDVSKDEARLVPLATLIASDPSLARVVGLKVGAGVWRDADGGDWNEWVSRENSG